MKSPVKYILHILIEKPSGTSLGCQSWCLFYAAAFHISHFFHIKDKWNFHFLWFSEDLWPFWIVLPLWSASQPASTAVLFSQGKLFIETQKHHSPAMSSTLSFTVEGLSPPAAFSRTPGATTATATTCPRTVISNTGHRAEHKMLCCLVSAQ